MKLRTLIYSVFFGICAFSYADGSKEMHLQPMDLFALDYIADPQISPDGSKVVYVRKICDVQEDRRYSDLWLIDFDGSDHHQLTNGNWCDTNPRWSPDGEQIAFLSNRDGQTQIYTCYADDAQVEQLTWLDQSPSGISWAPDGKTIAFAQSVLVDEVPLAKVPAKETWAPSAQIIRHYPYRHDGSGYVKNAWKQIFTVSLEDQAIRQVTDSPFHHGGTGWQSTIISWDPDGTSLLIAMNRDEREIPDCKTFQLCRIDLVSGAVQPLSDASWRASSPNVSPDGTAIAWAGYHIADRHYHVPHLQISDQNGVMQTTFDRLDRTCYSPTWTSDGKGVVFFYDDEGNTKLGYYRCDGEFCCLATHLGGNGTAYGGPFGGAAFSIATNGNFVCNVTRAVLPSALVAGNIANDQTQTILTLNSPLLQTRTLASAEEFWFDASLDGRKLQGWIIKPPHFDPAKKYPMILDIHGGPTCNFGDRFDIEKQIWAAAGYVVAYINPRGSTSYGEEFIQLIDFRFPCDQEYDILSGVNAVIEKGFIDTNNLFVTGASAGGWLACWLIGHTDQFNAAAPVYPVVNLISQALTSDIGHYKTQYMFDGPPWESPQEYWLRSPLSLVGSVTTPTMIMTGVEDYRTPISQAEEYYQALKLKNVEGMLVRFPEEPHGIRARPSHHMAKALYILEWFETHKEWPEPESNRRHKDFQSSALPTELSGLWKTWQGA